MVLKGDVRMNERFKLIKPYIENKTVLDIGCCGWYSRHKEENIVEGWLHNNIKKHAKSVLGIDISKECIKFLKEKGYNVEVANAEDFNLNQKFDVIVAGELIEHLSNFQGFLNSVRKHLKEDGLLILTTPNVFYFKETLFLVLRGYPPVNPEHTCYFDEVTLRQLLNRFGFSIKKIMYTTERDACTMYKKCNQETPKLKDVILRLTEELIPFKRFKHNTIIMIAKKCKGAT